MKDFIRFAILSDTHGDSEIMSRIIGKYSGVVDNWFHCGDSELPPEYIQNEFVGVRGNCDYFAGLPLTRDLRFPFGVVHLEHGNRTGGITKEYVESLHCKYFFSGHTHKKLAIYHPFGCWQFNPGSLIKPRDGEYGSFLFVDVRKDDGKLVSYQFHLVDPKTGEEIPGGETYKE